MTSAVLDIKTGKIYFGDSGFIAENINAELTRRMPRISSTKWPVANCAEFNALNAGARMQDLVVTTVRVSNSVLAPMCRNCVQSLKGVLLVVSG